MFMICLNHCIAFINNHFLIFLLIVIHNGIIDFTDE